MLKNNTYENFIKIKFRIYYLTIFRLKTFIRRKINTLFNFNRSSSLPYVTGDGFRSIAQHIFDECSEVKSSAVAPGDIVFVRADLLHTFFKKVHPKINSRYILISHNSDQNINDLFIKYIDDKIIHWYAQNVCIKHHKITPIPIGLPLRMYDRDNTIVRDLETYINMTSTSNKEPAIYYGFSEETNKRRSIALLHLKRNVQSITSPVKLTRKQYYSKMSRYQFNASPEGAGIDCHRTWESIYLGVVPIVERSPSTEFFSEIGLPMLLIDSWEEIASIMESELQAKYKTLSVRFDSPAQYFEYWLTEILKRKNE